MLIEISKAGKSLDVNWDEMPDNAKEYIIKYGLKQKLNDAGASATVKELGEKEAAEQSFSAAEEVLSALMAGNITIRQAAVAMSLEERTFLKVLKALYKKIFKEPLEDLNSEEAIDAIAKKLGKNIDKVREAVDKHVEKQLVVELKILEAKKESPELSI